MEDTQRILFITPIKHLKEFYSDVCKRYRIVELTEPTYSSTKKILPQYDILFCAPNHQGFIVDEDLVRELHDKTLGIIGYGRLGKMVEKLCTPLFKEVICVDKNDSYDKLKDIDVLSIHIDLNPTTYQMINKKFINKLNKSVYIVNTSRGEVVNENDINDYLNIGKVIGYATDVTQDEYTEDYSVIKNNPNVYITPHIAGVTLEAQEKAYKRVLEKYENTK